MAHSIVGAADVELQRRILELNPEQNMPGRAPLKVRIERRRDKRFPRQAVVVDRRGKRVRSIAPIPIAAGMP